MTKPAISTLLRDVQEGLNALNDSLRDALALARHSNLAPFRLQYIQAAIDHNRHAWHELNRLATSLELTAADHKL